MSRLEQSVQPIEPISDFGEIRTDVAHRLFRDPSYSSFDAMYEMSIAAERYIGNLALHYPENKLWVGGSLGRREMLPNSDIDLFVIYDDEDQPQNDIHVDGVDKFEIGHISKNRLAELLQYSFIDANRFLDGRRIGTVPANDVEQMVLEVSTPDRQLANNISEYFFYKYFDFPKKTTPMGPNLKYSTGSSRDTIFFNMIARMGSYQFPATRGTEPELSEVLRYAEDHFGVRSPVEAINLMFTVKNAAISSFDATNDPRHKYVSHYSLESIYEYCKDKFRALGYGTETEFIEVYKSARREIEYVVDTIFTAALNENPASIGIDQILKIPREQLAERCIAEIDDPQSDHPQSYIAMSAWLKMREGGTAEEMDQMAEHMIKQPIDRVWGGLMALVCSRDTSDMTLNKLSDWLYANEKGAYLLKLITRNTSASIETKTKTLAYYREKEIIL